MKNFYIITNTIKDPDRAVTNLIERVLTGRGATCVLRDERERPAGAAYRYTDPDQIPAGAECMIVLGGDGTLLRSATDTIDRQIPLLGVNLGTLGFLAEVDRNSIEEALDQLLRDEYEIEERMLLAGAVVRDGQVIAREIALNDVIIRRDSAFGIITVTNYVNGAFLKAYKADGIIVSTPTGSTGYSLSIGGPIISPSAELFLMTPLAAHELNSRSIVLPCDDVIRVEIGPGRDGATEHAAAYFDGDTKVCMLTGDAIEITRAERNARFVKLRNDSFLETVSHKMNSYRGDKDR